MWRTGSLKKFAGLDRAQGEAGWLAISLENGKGRPAVCGRPLPTMTPFRVADGAADRRIEAGKFSGSILTKRQKKRYILFINATKRVCIKLGPHRNRGQVKTRQDTGGHCRF